jgi:hypothetical protein
MIGSAEKKATPEVRGRTDPPHHPLTRSLPRPPHGDPRRRYLDALDRIPPLERLAQSLAVDVTAGGSPQRAEAARKKLEDARADVLLARIDSGELLLHLLRAALAEPAQRSAVVLALLMILRPELEPVADRMDGFERQVRDLRAEVKELQSALAEAVTA